MQTFGELIRETPDEVRASFRVDKDTGAVASCGRLRVNAHDLPGHKKGGESECGEAVHQIITDNAP